MSDRPALQCERQPSQSPRRLTCREMAETFSAMKSQGLKLREIQERTGFSPSAISRAIARLLVRPSTQSGRSAAGHATAMALGAARALRPPGIDAEAGTSAWYLQNCLSARSELRAAARRAFGEGPQNGGAGGKKPNQSGVECGAAFPQGAQMHATGIDSLLDGIGVEIQNPSFRAELAYALGAQEAADRMRAILSSEVAKQRPLNAIRLGLEMRLSASEVLELLAALPVERADAPSDSGQDHEGAADAD